MAGVAEQLIDRRLGRADNELIVLHDEVTAFLKGDPFTVSQQVQLGDEIAPGDDLPYVVKVSKEPELWWSLLVSEIIHHLHTTLDNLAWQIATVHAGSPPRGTAFPTYRSVTDYRTTWSKQSGYYATRGMPDHAQAIIEDVQPYHRRNKPESHPLWILRRLANEDKHESSHLFGSALARVDHETVGKGVAQPTKPKVSNGPFIDGAVLARWPLPAGPTDPSAEVKMGISFSFDVAFGEASPAKGKSVYGMLKEIRDDVRGVTDRLRPFL